MDTLQRLVSIANTLDELGYTKLADDIDALLKTAAANPYAWNPKADQADESRSSVLREARREVEHALARAVRVMDQSPFAVFTISLKRQQLGPFEIELLYPHAKPFNSLEAATAFFRENERSGREGYMGLQRKRERLRAMGDHELLRDVMRGGRPDIVG